MMGVPSHPESVITAQGKIVVQTSAEGLFITRTCRELVRHALPGPCEACNTAVQNFSAVHCLQRSWNDLFITAPIRCDEMPAALC